MIEIFMALAMNVIYGNPNQLNATLQGNVKWGNYYQVVEAKCDPITNRTYAIGVRYQVNDTLDKRVMHAQVLSDSGCHDNSYFAKKAVADSYIEILK